ncbi:hypothetical protein ACSMXN_00130 [Jatrophihabitans sp. DSM 45814]
MTNPMTSVTRMTNAGGELTLRPALARGVTVANGLRGLMDLDQSRSPQAGVGKSTSPPSTLAPELAAKWRGTAIASVLGQLAATVTGASAQLLHSCCGVAKQRNSIAGIESIFLSALLGTADGARDLDLAEATWAALPSPKVTPDGVVPVLDPVAGELCFLSGRDLASLTGLALKAQLQALRKSHAVPAGETADQMRFGAAVLLSASSTMSVAILAPLADTATQKAAAIAALGPNGASGGLPLALIHGTALLVQTELLEDNGDVSSGPPSDWKSVWPQTEALPTGVNPNEATRHPYWKASQLCPALPTTGSALEAQVLQRENTLVLQSVPQVAFDGSVLRQGFYPPQYGTPPVASDSNGGWRWQPGSQQSTAVIAVPGPHIDATPMKLIGGVPIDPLTGNPVDPVTGQPIPGHRGGSTAGAAVRQQLVTAVQSGRFNTNASLGDVLDRLIATDYQL